MKVVKPLRSSQDFVEQPPFDMEASLEESTAITPFFFVLFPGRRAHATGVGSGWSSSSGNTKKTRGGLDGDIMWPTR